MNVMKGTQEAHLRIKKNEVMMKVHIVIISAALLLENYTNDSPKKAKTVGPSSGDTIL